MSTPLQELTALVDALRAETTEQSITPERMGAVLQRMIDVLPSVSDANSLKGWVAISSINELPSNPSPTQRALAYLLDTTLYVYVGEGGDTLDGKYQSAELKGTKGDTGNAGKDGKDGVDLGLVNIVDDLETGTSTDVLSGRMGKELNNVLKTIKGTSQETYSHETEDFWISGKYWKGNGVGQAASFGSDSASNYSIPVQVKIGDVISYRGGGYGYVIVTCDSAGANAKCLVASPSTYGTADAPDVTIAEDGYVSFGFRKPTATYTCAIKITRNIDKIAELEEGFSQNAEDIETLNSAVESIEEQLTDDTFPMQRMYPLFWKTANTYRNTDWQTSSRYDLLTDLIAIPDGISKMKITLESGDGTPLTELYPSIYFYDANLEPTDASSSHQITLNEDKSIPVGSKWYLFKFGYNTPNSIYRAMLPSFMQTKYILHAPMTQEQYDNKFMQSYEDGRQQLHTYDWDDLKLTTACMAGYGVASRKDFQLAIMTDSHGNHLYVDNMLRLANEHKTIDAIVHCGDWQPSTYNQPASRKQFIELFSKSTKPVYVAIGNHDHGYNYVSMCASQKMLYNDIVAPMVANGWLVAGEYTENKCYFYHDFVDAKVRLIVLYDYDNDDLADNEYWEPVTYDPEAPSFLYNHTYTYDASNPTIVNCGEYNEHSFRLKKSVTTAGSGAPYQRDATIPCMAVDWQSRIFSQQQAQWLANTLLSTPANFKVVIASHQPFSLNVTLQNKKFSQFNIYNPNISNWHAEHIATDFLAACVDAFQRGVAFSHKVVMQGLASYLNTQTSGGLSYAYEVTANFANKNSGATFMCFIGGHCHPDLIWKHNTYTQWGIYSLATRNNAGSTNDILDLSSPDYPNCNHWNAISLGKIATPADRTIGLARVGKDLTKDLTRRDVEFIDTSE